MFLSVNSLWDGSIVSPPYENPKNNPIDYYCRRPDDQVALGEALAMIQEKSIIEESYTVADSFSAKALKTLDSLEANDAKLALQELVPYLVRRRI